MQERLTLRSASPQDLSGAESLLREAGLLVDGLPDHFGPAYTVREVEGRIVALAGVERHGAFGLLRSVAVTPKDRGTGIGQELLRDRIRWARNEGLQALFLLTETAPTFFQRFGFRVMNRSQAPREILGSTEWSRACPQTAVAMRLDLEGE